MAFPDIHVTIEHMLTENSIVLIFLNWTGTHKGEFQGMPATNKQINMRTADLFRIDTTNGTIIEHWGCSGFIESAKTNWGYYIQSTKPNTK